MSPDATPLTTPELHHAVATAKHELDAARSAGNELRAALAEEQLNGALDDLSERLAATAKVARVDSRPKRRTALRGSGA